MTEVAALSLLVPIFGFWLSRPGNPVAKWWMLSLGFTGLNLQGQMTKDVKKQSKDL